MKTFGICVESSNKKGMGHLFRAINFIEFIKSMKERYILIVNDDKRSISVLKKKRIKFEVVMLEDTSSDWETGIIRKHKIDIWINDRLNTKRAHSKNVKKNGIKLISFDDMGSGAEMADINFGFLPYYYRRAMKGKRVLKGLSYLILNSFIGKFMRRRDKIRRILVTLGGSDTYGVTIKVVELLKAMCIKAEIIAGPCFKHIKKLKKVAGKGYVIIDSVPSLVRKFHGYDLAITGGGVTPFEANASGLPCIIIANELHEIENGIFLERLGSSVFAGYYKDIDSGAFRKKLDISVMSRKGLEALKVCGAKNVYSEINSL